MTEIAALTPLTELPLHWTDELLATFHSDIGVHLRPMYDRKRSQPFLDNRANMHLELINALIASGKARVQIVEKHVPGRGDMEFVGRRLVIDLSENMTAHTAKGKNHD